jgi:hypothetical protein
MKRYGRVCVARKRLVPWCTRPVAEYGLPVVGQAANDALGDGGFAALEALEGLAFGAVRVFSSNSFFFFARKSLLVS